MLGKERELVAMEINLGGSWVVSVASFKGRHVWSRPCQRIPHHLITGLSARANTHTHTCAPARIELISMPVSHYLQLERHLLYLIVLFRRQSYCVDSSLGV